MEESESNSNNGSVATIIEKDEEKGAEKIGCVEFWLNIRWRERGLVLYCGFIKLLAFAIFSLIVPFFPPVVSSYFNPRSKHSS